MDSNVDIKKFLFDQNNFDRPTLSPEEMAPTFSEAELDAAKRQAFEEGRAQGHVEERTRREQYIAAQIHTLTERLTTIIDAEQAREKRFEAEAIRVCAAAYSATFPALNAKFGVDHILVIVRQSLRDVEGLGQILVEVPIEDLEDVRTGLASPLRQFGTRLALEGLPDLAAGSLHIKWKDGGVVRDANALSKTITARLRDALAALPETLQDG